ncbi:MAG: BON domain-containing protein [Blastocatellia bacterium]
MADYYRNYGSDRYSRRYEDDDDRYRRNRSDRDEERGFMDRAGDEVRSWFGDEEAERRRRLDEMEDERRQGREGYRRDYGRDYGRESSYGNSGLSSSRGSYGREGYTGSSYGRDYGRDYGRSASGRDYGREGWRSSGSSDYGRDYGRGYYGSSYGGGYGSGSYGSTRGGYASEGGYTSGIDAGRYGTYGSDYGRDYGRSESDWRGQSRGYGGDYGPAGQYGRSGEREDESMRGYNSPSSWSYTEMWWIPGPHTGRGPSGYQRSDERITEDVNERLQQHGQVDASNISVSVNNGEVTLSGSVNSRLEKRIAEDVAESCSGVREVQNNLRVSREQSQQTSGSQALTTGSQTPTGSSQTQSSTGTTGQSSRSRTTSS